MDKAKIIDGKHVSSVLKSWIGVEVTTLLNTKDITPGLAVIIVGNDPASKVYVRNKTKTAKKLGMNIFDFSLPVNISQEDIRALIIKLNNDSKVHGILLQLPLPGHLNSIPLLSLIHPDKDVDALNPINAGKLIAGNAEMVPCTPLGSYLLIKTQLDSLSGKNVVIIGRSLLFGKPMGQILLLENSTVTMTHSRTLDIEKHCQRADILIAAVGNPEMVKASWVKKNAIVIDVGINRVKQDEEKYKILGDVDYENTIKVAKAITPVPGGVGPMTIACLMFNTLSATQIKNDIPTYPWKELYKKLI